MRLIVLSADSSTEQLTVLHTAMPANDKTPCMKTFILTFIVNENDFNRMICDFFSRCEFYLFSPRKKKKSIRDKMNIKTNKQNGR